MVDDLTSGEIESPDSQTAEPISEAPVQNEAPPSLDKVIASRAGVNLKTTPETTTPEVVEYPKTWKKDYADGWQFLPPEYQKYIKEREDMFSQHSSRWGNEKNHYSKTAKELDIALADYADQISSGETTHTQLINTWSQADKMIRENPALAIMNIAKTHNIDLGQLSQVHPIQYENLSLQGQLARRQWEEESYGKAQQLEAQQQGMELLERFSSEVGTDGQPLRPYLSYVSDQVAQNITALRQQAPHLPAEDLLQMAYDEAVKQHGLIKQLEEAKQLKAEQEAMQRADRARRASGVRTASGSVPTGAKKLDDIIKKRISNMRV